MPNIWIDAGHGGKNPGAVNGLRLEKEDTLRFALELERQFRAQGCMTVMTRTTDETVSLDYRTALERRSKCDLAISCHRNAAGADAKGLEIWLHHAAIASTVQWAADVAQEIEKTGMPLRAGTAAKGVYRGFWSNPQADYQINRETNSPSMLLELGFLTNAEDNAVFDAQMQALCAAVVRASCNFLGVAYKEGTPPAVDDADYKTLYAETHEKLLEWQNRADAAERKLQKIFELTQP